MKKNQDIKSYSGGVNIKTYCNINGVWRLTNNINIVVGGINKRVTEPKVNINGVWKDEHRYEELTIQSGTFYSNCDQDITITFYGGVETIINGQYSTQNTIKTTTLYTDREEAPYIKIGSTLLSGTYAYEQIITKFVPKNTYVTIGTYYSIESYTRNFNISVSYKKQI